MLLSMKTKQELWKDDDRYKYDDLTVSITINCLIHVLHTATRIKHSIAKYIKTVLTTALVPSVISSELPSPHNQPQSLAHLPTTNNHQNVLPHLHHRHRHTPILKIQPHNHHPQQQLHHPNTLPSLASRRDLTIGTSILSPFSLQYILSLGTHADSAHTHTYMYIPDDPNGVILYLRQWSSARAIISSSNIGVVIFVPGPGPRTWTFEMKYPGVPYKWGLRL